MKKVFVILALAILIHSLNAQDSGSIAQINGIEMYYEIYGSGEALILPNQSLGSTFR